jgi:hypothetical protein
MIGQTYLAGTFTLSGTSIKLNRMGYGAMQLAGPQVWGPPRDIDVAIAVLREAVASGMNHMDTSDFYGPHVTNQLIKRTLHPYPDGLVAARHQSKGLLSAHTFVDKERLWTIQEVCCRRAAQLLRSS